MIESQAITLPLISVCSKDCFNFIMKPSKVPREREAKVKVKVSCQKVNAHVVVDPLFMYERVKATCFSSVS